MMYLESAALRLSGPNGYGYGPGCCGNDENFIAVQECAYHILVSSERMKEAVIYL